MVKSILTFSDIILYWDIEQNIDNYYIYIDNELMTITNKTHVTIRNIKKESVNISIFTDDNRKKVFYKETFYLPLKPQFIDVTANPYNAVGDGKTLNTKALQKAINDCKKNECVYIPKGVFLSGALNLHSDMQIYIEKDGVLQGSDNPSDYLPKIWSRFEGIEMECYSSLLNLGNIENRDEYSCENIIIYGGGKICGGGKALAENIISREKENFKISQTELAECETEDTIPGRTRSKLINISCCQNVIIDNIEIANGSCWNVHMIYSNNIVTCNCTFFSYDVHNGDGWDPDSSENCTLFNCDFNTGDDCVAIKSGKNPEGNIVNKPCKEIRVFDCRTAYGHSFAIGSEMSGGVDGVYIWDCDMRNTKFGLEVKGTKKRGGYVKNIYMTRCILPRIMLHAVDYNDDGISASEIPVFSDCNFDNLVITGEALEHKSNVAKSCDAIELKGFDDKHLTKNIIFNNIVIDNQKDSVNQTISLQMVDNITISNLSVR